MTLQKQAVPINFREGLDLKTDPKQVGLGKFLSLKNSIFTKAGLLQKRNGYQELASLPNNSSTYATTFNGNMTAIGTNISAYSTGTNTWVNKGLLQPVTLSTLPLVRTNNSQLQSDSVVASNGLVCTVYTDNAASGVVYKYVVADSVTGQNLLAPVTIANAAGSPRVFILGNYFMVVFTATISATSHLQYIAVNLNTLVSGTATDISTTYTPATTVAFDGYVANNSLYLAWNGSDGGGAIRVTYIDSTLTQHNTVVFTGKVATLMSVCADVTGSTAIIYVSFYNSGSSTGFTLAVNQQLNTVLAPTSIITSGTILNITSAARNAKCLFVYETAAAYSNSVPTNFITGNDITQAGVVGTPEVILRSVGIASKAFLFNGKFYFLAAYQSPYQSTYFLIDWTDFSASNIYAKLAYSNGGGYLTLGLPSALINSSGQVPISYLIQDLIEPTNKAQGAPNQGLPTHAQIGVNLVKFNMASPPIDSAEIGSALNVSGGFVWSYDGFLPVEQNFFLWPDNVTASASTSSGHLTAQQYFYAVTYEWADNSGNIQRSAPSIPVTVTTTGSTSTVTLNIPTLRITYKTSTPVQITIYRWSVGQPIYYQVGTVNNALGQDSVSFADTLADSTIIGGSILYTNGGVVEDISPPATSIMALYKSRLMLVDAEDPNLLWYSKQVIESTPVEFSDLFTIYVAPTESAQGSTGPITALSAMDDKLIIFKKDAIYYITGNGPDNTGANDDFSDPIFITATVGSANQASIVFIPQGLMFQSDKGIWLLGRDLSTQYIGAPVEDFNSFNVNSAVNIPGTNYVLFTLSSGVTLMYDYFFNQWGTFVGVPAISSTLFQNLHTFINGVGEVFQELPDSFVDGANAVLMQFTTSWINLAGLQGYQRAYFFTMLGQFLSPHQLIMQIGYDYAENASQQTVISPFNYNAAWGGNPTWGSGNAWGGTSPLEQWKIHLTRQTCQAFQISMQEIFDANYGTTPGAGLTLSGLNLVLGLKKGWKPLGEQRSAG